jgi:hypothetical protein
MLERAHKRLRKKARKGFRGWPMATVTYYSPDDRKATKVAVGILPPEDAEVTGFCQRSCRRLVVPRHNGSPLPR